jgi:signal transduction histidine kinase
LADGLDGSVVGVDEALADRQAQAGPARVPGDERRLRQVVTNLVSNAVKFTAEGSITITVAGPRRRAAPAGVSEGSAQLEDACTLAVADTGPGIAAEQMPRLFAEFVQLGSLRQRARGTGLGLAICKRLIDAHHGTIEAVSQEGKGTTFTVRLPMSVEATLPGLGPALPSSTPTGETRR